MKKAFRLKDARTLLPKRLATAHKANAGKSLIIAGSTGMFGAAVLAASAAARVGSGYVFLLTDSKAFPIAKYPDFLIRDSKINKISSLSFNAVAIGPGLGRNNLTAKLLKDLIKTKAENVLVDADALIIAIEKKLFPLPPSGPQTWILTPHEGELSRMLGIKSETIRKDREKYIRLAQKKFGGIVLLKGHKTLIASDQTLFEIQSGNPSLAKAGTGDVLSGMITGFLAQGLKPLEAVCLGAYLHGAIADSWIKEKKDVLSLMASDLLNKIPQTLYKLR